MRDIKFIAYGKFPDKKGIDNWVVENWQESTDMDCVGFNGGGHFEVMQYTGLKDKNGVEIYENDIVLYPGMRHSVIEWDTDTASMMMVIPHHDVLRLTKYKAIRLEIIGNVYQTPELLGKQNDE